MFPLLRPGCRGVLGDGGGLGGGQQGGGDLHRAQEQGRGLRPGAGRQVRLVQMNVNRVKSYCGFSSFIKVFPSFLALIYVL